MKTIAFRLDSDNTENALHQYLQFSEEEQKRAWPSEQYSNDVARWNAYLNRLSLNVLMPWLQKEWNLPLSVWSSQSALPTFWDWVNGTAVNIDNTRIVLIASEASSVEEFSVPQEWVDLPSWAGSYYLAVQIEPYECWLCVWGYATHKQLKESGSLDKLSRTYSLPGEELIEDIEAIEVALELDLDEKADIKPLSPLSKSEAERLLEQLSQPCSYSPRLNPRFKFEQWAALIENTEWRQQLYARRTQKVIAEVQPEKNLVNLSAWLQNVFEAGWQTFEEAFSTGESDLSFGFRSRWDSLAIEAESPETIRNQIKLIADASLDEHRRKQAAKRVEANLVEYLRVDRQNPEIKSLVSDAIAALNDLQLNAEDEETRWAAAESLWTIDPTHPAVALRRVAVKDLGMQLRDRAVALMVAILKKPDSSRAVLVRAYPMRDKRFLPAELQLMVLDEDGETFLETQARGADNLIQLKFSGEQGDRFSVRVALEDAQITEDFVI